MEDEKHFLTECIKYAALRQNLYTKVALINEHFLLYSQEDKFLWLMSNEDGKVQEALAKYIYQALDMGKRPSCQ
jgi:hypothetical protein